MLRCSRVHPWRRFSRALSSNPTSVPFLSADRGVIEVSGEEAREFLDNLLTNDLADPRVGSLSFHALLSSKGRCVFETLVHEVEDSVFWLDVHTSCIPAAMRALRRYKLRSRVELVDRSGELGVVIGDGEVDPREERLGRRRVVVLGEWDGDGASEARDVAFGRRRMEFGVVEGKEAVGAIPLEWGIERMHGVSFDKGCYVGQELMARTHFRGMLRKLAVPITLQGVDVEKLRDPEWKNGAGTFAPQQTTIEPAQGGRRVGKLLAVAADAPIGVAILPITQDSHDTTPYKVKGLDVTVERA